MNTINKLSFSFLFSTMLASIALCVSSVQIVDLNNNPITTLVNGQRFKKIITLDPTDTEFAGVATVRVIDLFPFTPGLALPYKVTPSQSIWHNLQLLSPVLGSSRVLGDYDIPVSLISGILIIEVIALAPECGAEELYTNTVQFSIPNGATLKTLQASVTLTNPQPTVRLTGATANETLTLCEGKTLKVCAIPQIDNSDDEFGQYSYLWTKDGVEFARSQCIKIKHVHESDEAVYEVEVSTCNKCVGKAQFTLNVEQCPRISVSKCAQVLTENIVAYQIRVCNNSDVPAQNVTVSDNIPSCLQIISPIELPSPEWIITSPAPELRIKKTTPLAPHACETITIRANVIGNCEDPCVNTVRVKADRVHRKSASSCLCFARD